MVKKLKYFTSKYVQKLLVNLAKPEEGATYLTNRNPRNLELMKIAYKPSGYHLEEAGRCYWNKLIVNKSPKNVSAQVVHYKGNVLVQASTLEWSIQKQLYRPYDTSAYINLGRIMAERCLQAGIIEVYCNIEATPEGKVDKFLKEFEKSGVAVTESERFKKKYAYDRTRDIKPWEVHLD